MADAVAAARATILEANRVKLEALDAEEREIRWAITSIYNYDVQHGLNEALTAARDAMNATCDQRNAYLADAIA